MIQVADNFNYRGKKPNFDRDSFDTLYDVLSQNNPVQFVSWKRRDKAHPTETEYQSIYNVLNGNTDLLRNDTMNFSTYPLTSNLDVKICCHYFCY